MKTYFSLRQTARRLRAVLIVVSNKCFYGDRDFATFKVFEKILRDIGSFGQAARPTATTLLGLNQFFAIDNSKEMVEQCEKNLHNKVDNLQAICDDINQVKINSASIVVLNLTLQFIDVNLRSNLIKKIYDGLESGGILIISEKIHFDDAVTQNQITKLHMDFKKENGYSELEIANKRQAIENVLITETKEQHLNRLRDCGFVETSCFFQCLNFVSFLSVK